MNILILGSGGREHALAWKIKQSKKCSNLYVGPGNAGTSTVAENVNLGVTDFEAIANFLIEKNIHLLVVGPEVPLVEGIRDYLEGIDELKSLKIVGPSRNGALLEGSKEYAKQFMKSHDIPTADSRAFTRDTFEEAKSYVLSQQIPIVLKADGLAAGKGVIICNSHEEAVEALEEMLLKSKFGEASTTVVIEEFLEGIELSVFVLTDGNSYKILPEAKDYKRIGEGDTGPNTGGMGAVSPVNFAQEGFLKKVEEKVVIPTINGLKKDRIDYKGFVFIVLMNVKGEPYVIEYNVRMGDPETQAVLPRIASDLVELLEGCADGTLEEKAYNISSETFTTVVMVSGGYPDKYAKGFPITGLEDNTEGSLVFHAGTAKNDSDEIVNSGGRVLNITGHGSDIQSALNNAYQRVANIQWKDNYYRKDIGLDLIALER